MIKQFLLVGLGGAIGSVLRYAGSLFHPPKSFPLNTLLINVIGSFIIGIVIGCSLKNETYSNWKLFLATGLCGGFTTFSAFSFENFLMIQEGKPLLSLIYIVGSVLFGITATWIGFKIIN